ncbi:MAG: two-component sensor histidine kinase [Deferribacteraceae bacterium]|nr:two-component sensor histidine kinase [Deferribacteraceae bacterium]
MEKKPEQQIVSQSVNVELLSQAMEAFNAATVKLQSSYELLQDEARKLREEIEDKNRRLSDMSKLLESVLNNTHSSILVIDVNGGMIINNRAGDRLLTEFGEEEVYKMLRSLPSEGIFDYDNGEGRYFNISAGRLDSENFNGTVFVVDDITTLKKLEWEKQRGEKLQLMGEMAANIAHEIRNPLGSMELFASLLERDLDGDPDRTKYTTSIVKAVRAINSIISNTLLFTKEVQIKKERHLLADIVDEVVLYLQHTLKDKRVLIANKLNESHTVYCDRELFRQVVMNLVHNAVDAVNENGTVTLESFEDTGGLHLHVTDNGGGLSTSMRPKLFMPFQTSKAKGTGLGLSIAYKIMRAHEGDITADSDGKSYTRFVVTMPAEKVNG